MGILVKPCSVELHNLYFPPNIIRVIKEDVDRTCSMQVMELRVNKILICEFEIKRPLWKPMHRLEYNSKIF